MELDFLDKQVECAIDKQSLFDLVEHVLKTLEIKTDEVAIHFVSKERIKDLHAIYFNDPTETDCISFPIDESETVGYDVLGDVFVCPAVAFEFAEAHNIDPLEEISRYVVHGLLHLIGYEDSGEKAKEMEVIQEKMVQSLKAKGKLVRQKHRGEGSS